MCCIWKIFLQLVTQRKWVLLLNLFELFAYLNMNITSNVAFFTKVWSLTHLIHCWVFLGGLQKKTFFWIHSGRVEPHEQSLLWYTLRLCFFLSHSPSIVEIIIFFWNQKQWLFGFNGEQLYNHSLPLLQTLILKECSEQNDFIHCMQREWAIHLLPVWMSPYDWLPGYIYN